jgi:hypothetical protein
METIIEQVECPQTKNCLQFVKEYTNKNNIKDVVIKDVDISDEYETMKKNNITLEKIAKEFDCNNFFNPKFIEYTINKLELEREPTFSGYPLSYLELAFSPGYVKILTGKADVQYN